MIRCYLSTALSQEREDQEDVGREAGRGDGRCKGPEVGTGLMNREPQRGQCAAAGDGARETEGPDHMGPCRPW